MYSKYIVHLEHEDILPSISDQHEPMTSATQNPLALKVGFERALYDAYFCFLGARQPDSHKRCDSSATSKSALKLLGTLPFTPVSFSNLFNFPAILTARFPRVRPRPSEVLR